MNTDWMAVEETVVMPALHMRTAGPSSPSRWPGWPRWRGRLFTVALGLISGTGLGLTVLALQAMGTV